MHIYLQEGEFSIILSLYIYIYIYIYEKKEITL